MLASRCKKGLATCGDRALEVVRRNPILTVAVLFLVIKQTAVIWYIVRTPRLTPNMFVALTGEALALVAWAFVLVGWKRLAALALVDLGTGALLLSDLLYFRMFADLPSAASLKHVGLLGEMNGMGEIIDGIFHPFDLLLFAGVPIVLLAGILFPWVRNDGRISARRALPLTAVGALLLVAVSVTSASVRKPFGGHTHVASRLGPVGYHAFDFGTLLAHDIQRRLVDDEEELAELRGYFDSRPARPRHPDSAGLARGKNVIFVQLESWQAFPLFREVNGRRVTPNMDRLAAESLYFPRFWSQVQQGTTSDAELLAQCSIYPSRTGSVYYDRAGADFHCLPEILREHGYRTVAMHGNRPDFWNRASIYPAVGIDRFYDIRDFEGLPAIGLGTADIEFFEEAVRKLEAEPQPFYALLITITSHTPFDFPGLPKADLDFGKFENTPVARYLSAVHYTDRAIGLLIDRLRASGLLDRSVLILYGDHKGVIFDESVEEFLGIPTNDPVRLFEFERLVAATIRLPGGALAGRYEVAAGQLDLAPTVARLLDLPLKTTSFLGRDLLSPVPGLVVFPNGSVTTDSLLALSSDGGRGDAGCYALPGGNRVPTGSCEPLFDLAERELDVSRRLLDGDLVDRIARPRGTTTASHP